MAPPQGNRVEEGEHIAPGGVSAEEDAQRDHLVGMMAGLGLGVGQQESAAAAAAVVPFGGAEVDSAYVSRFWEERAAAAARLWGQGPAPAGRFVHGRRPYGAGPPPHGARRHEEGRRRGRDRIVGPRNCQGVFTLPAAPSDGAIHGGHAYLAQPPYMYSGAAIVIPPRNPEPPPSEPEQEVLSVLFQEPAEDIVSYACNLLESTHGQRLFRLVFVHCNLELREWIIASITRDKKSFWRISSQRSAEVVCMIEYGGTRRSMLLLREAMLCWIAPNIMHPLLSDSNRVRVVLAFIKNCPRDIVQFIFEAVFTNCTRLACQPNGLSLLQDCLLFHGSEKEKEDIFTAISCKSLQLSQNSCGNYIVQDVLKKGSPLHFTIIASCLKTNYVGLSRQKYSSNVVEQCLRVFDEGERFVIVNELITYPHFRDLVTDEYANFVLSTALQTCSIPLQHMLATAILSQNINYRNQHCLKIFGLLSKLGYMQ
ncbi:hypothetical protein QOZ80_6BG0486760 [Eleusine coracana subsp. coracana]|nr:hypothetical protein QOZ80_6BG0486760 [Eleusine coracana subsp. coracana]